MDETSTPEPVEQTKPEEEAPQEHEVYATPAAQPVLTWTCPKCNARALSFDQRFMRDIAGGATIKDMCKKCGALLKIKRHSVIISQNIGPNRHQRRAGLSVAR